MEKVKYPEMTEYISVSDANKIQIMCKQIFENFDGGFGGALDDKHLCHQPITERMSVSYGFVTDGPNANDISVYTWKPNDLKMEDYTPYRKSIRYSILEVLFEICKILNVEFAPNKKCINECFEKLQNEKE